MAAAFGSWAASSAAREVEATGTVWMPFIWVASQLRHWAKTSGLE